MLISLKFRGRWPYRAPSGEISFFGLASTTTVSEYMPTCPCGPIRSCLRWSATTPNIVYSTLPRDNPAKSSDLALSEQLFPSDICQLRIGGRNGSNACTVIASLFCLRFLQPDDTPLEAQLCAGVERILLDGNARYDHTGQAGLLAVDEVLLVQPSIGVENAGELFYELSRLDPVLVLLAEDAEATNRSVGVLVFNPYSFALAYDASYTTLMLFNSHAHGEAGAFLAYAPHAVALVFLKSSSDVSIALLVRTRAQWHSLLY